MVNPSTSSVNNDAQQGGGAAIVVAVDGSEASNVAVQWAANAALKRGDSLKLVCAYNMPQFMYADGMVPPQELYDELEGEAKDKIATARKIVSDFSPEIQVEDEVREAAPIDYLLDLSQTSQMLSLIHI